MEKIKKYILVTIFIIVPVLFLFSILKPPKNVNSQTTHVVISEIQIAGATSNDEFVELYNPTDQNVDLTGWRLSKKTASNVESDLIKNLSGTVKSHGFFLITHEDYDNTEIPGDLTYSENLIAADNTVLLYDNNGNLIDRVGMGSGAGDEETAHTSIPNANRSVERKANSSSTKASMETGVDQFAGNGHDSDNNSADFIYRSLSDPQNSSSSEEPVEETPTEVPTETPTETPILSPTPTEEPPTPTPTEESSPTPTLEPLPSPTLEPTATPTPIEEPTSTPTLEPSPTPMPTPTPSPKPTPADKVIGIFRFRTHMTICTLHYKKLSLRFIQLFIPHVSCQKEFV